MIDATYDLPNGSTVSSPEEAAERGYPIACAAFALCENAATRTVSHPILGGYPSCERCAAKLA